MREEDSALLSRREAADTLGVCIETVARLIRNGELRCVRIGKAVRVPRDDVASLVSRGEASTAPGPTPSHDE